MTVDVRALPRVLATVAAELELNEATYVTIDDIRRIANEHGITSDPSNIAYRLRQNGWLLPTDSSGVWEYAPAVNAGPYSRGDVFAALDGALSRDPSQDLRVALVSALWLHGWSERAPSRHEVAASPDAKVVSGLKRTYRIIRFESNLQPTKKRGRSTPIEAPETILTHIATHPRHVSSWETIELALPDLIENSSPTQLRRELEGRPSSVSTRLGYLLHAVAPNLVREVGLTPSRLVVRFGSDTRSIRFNSQWNVADSLLPFDPAKLGQT